MNASGLASPRRPPLSRSSYRSNQGGGDCLSILPCEQRSLTCLKSQDGELNHPGFGAHLLDWEGGCHAESTTSRPRAKAVRLVQEHRDDFGSEYEAIKAIAGGWA